MPTSPIVLTLYFLTIAICVFAIMKGGPAERLAGAIILANIALARIAGLLLSPNVELLVGLAADGVTAFALLAVTLRYPNPWLGGTMLLYAVQFSLHSFYFVTERPNDRLHVTVNNLVFLGISVILAAGTGLAWWGRIQRRRP